MLDDVHRQKLQDTFQWKTKNNVFRFTVWGSRLFSIAFFSTAAFIFVFPILPHHLKAMYSAVAIVMGTTIRLFNQFGLFAAFHVFSCIGNKR